MTTAAAPPPQPYRWSLSAFGGGRPDRLGALAARQDQSPPSDLVLRELTAVTAKVLARADGADLCFLGRSLDSMYDLLTGALEHSPWDGRLLRLPVSCMADTDWSPAATRRFREHLASVGLEPYALARRKRPIALVDVVAEGRSYGTLHRHLADWIEETREPWAVIRRKLRYIAVTCRHSTSPNTWRWQQDPDNDWVRTLPAPCDRRVPGRPGLVVSGRQPGEGQRVVPALELVRRGIGADAPPPPGRPRARRGPVLHRGGPRQPPARGTDPADGP
ncbi:hypothetical protein OG501_32140 [Streptomyces niveus]|uniref:hypothetical protein n=1 Tax=Streptomyces niveus TaxID=193462 RepID=UPI0038659C2A